MPLNASLRMENEMESEQFITTPNTFPNAAE